MSDSADVRAASARARAGSLRIHPYRFMRLGVDSTSTPVHSRGAGGISFSDNRNRSDGITPGEEVVAFRRLDQRLLTDTADFPHVHVSAGVVHPHEPITLVLVCGEKGTALLGTPAARDATGYPHAIPVQPVPRDGLAIQDRRHVKARIHAQRLDRRNRAVEGIFSVTEFERRNQCVCSASGSGVTC